MVSLRRLLLFHVDGQLVIDVVFGVGVLGIAAHRDRQIILGAALEPELPHDRGEILRGGRVGAVVAELIALDEGVTLQQPAPEFRHPLEFARKPVHLRSQCLVTAVDGEGRDHVVVRGITAGVAFDADGDPDGAQPLALELAQVDQIPVGVHTPAVAAIVLVAGRGDGRVAPGHRLGLRDHRRVAVVVRRVEGLSGVQGGGGRAGLGVLLVEDQLGGILDAVARIDVAGQGVASGSGEAGGRHRSQQLAEGHRFLMQGMIGKYYPVLMDAICGPKAGRRNSGVSGGQAAPWVCEITHLVRLITQLVGIAAGCHCPSTRDDETSRMKDGFPRMARLMLRSARRARSRRA
ncbi:hypothetical protein MCA0446 [Methylococcus capsulatus str. Bath]|uniref:Uncharacterized protein n=1 Tax=Methylococcus capsulatus (strain ATCC 33009 / NCIMB 11132 / Bath) TaxID=243233 RepID=Q60BM0_METCA|nr:hypothetical protein MCA0446 [Methylococcus capsulatus str. Bath]